MRAHYFLTVVVFLLSASETAHAAPACDANVAGAPLKAIIAADNKGDIAAAMTHYAADPVWLPPTRLPLRGRAAVEASYRKMYGEFAPALSIDIDDTKAGGDVAVVHGRTHGTLQSRAKKDAVTVGDEFEAVVLCDEGAWRVDSLRWWPQGKK